MAEIAVQNQADLGSNSPAYVDASAGGDTFKNQFREPEVWVIVSSGADVTMTVRTQADCNFGDHPDKTITIPGSKSIRLGPFNYQRYSDRFGMAHIQFSDPTRVQVAIIKTIGPTVRD